jgi:Uma2 family endonuclease
MDYRELCADPHLRDLPFKIELNEHGTILMTPASNRHGRFQGRITSAIERIMERGDVICECSVDTAKGTKVMDVAWASPDFLNQHGDETPYPVAPEVCVEIVSPTNSPAEIGEKTDLYLARGAKEVWTCNDDGTLRFYSYQGEIPESKIVAGMPSKIELQ